MQYKLDQYNANEHDKYQALVLAQPAASNMVTKLIDHEDGTSTAIKHIAFIDGDQEAIKGFYIEDIVSGKWDVLSSEPILVCSTEEPFVHGLDCGATLGFVKLVNAKHTSDFTDEDWIAADIPDKARKLFKNKFGLFFQNPERVVEFPFIGNAGFYSVVYSKDTLIKYPTAIHVEIKDFKRTQENEKNRV